MTDKDKIKEEIGRMYKEAKSVDCFISSTIETTLERLRDFIDSLPEEHNEDLEEEIQRAYYDKSLYDADNLDRQDFNNIARHFAEWQKQKDQETIELAEDHAMLTGMMKERQEMMKDAVGAQVFQAHDIDKAYEGYVYIVSNQFKDLNLLPPNKVKIIIVKEN